VAEMRPPDSTSIDRRLFRITHAAVGLTLPAIIRAPQIRSESPLVAPSGRQVMTSCGRCAPPRVVPKLRRVPTAGLSLGINPGGLASWLLITIPGSVLMTPATTRRAWATTRPISLGLSPRNPNTQSKPQMATAESGEFSGTCSRRRGLRLGGLAILLNSCCLSAT